MSDSKIDSSESDKVSDKSFFCSEGVKKSLLEAKDKGLKNRLRVLILERGFKEEHNFFQELGLTRQYWYRISWGIDECPIYLKIKIAKALNVDSILIFERGIE